MLSVSSKGTEKIHGEENRWWMDKRKAKKRSCDFNKKELGAGDKDMH